MMIMSTKNDFSALTKFGNVLSDKIFDFSMVSNMVYDLFDLYIVSFYRIPYADLHIYFQNLLKLLESLLT